MSRQENKARGDLQVDGERMVGLFEYPMDMSAFLTVMAGELEQAAYHPTVIAQSGLAHWNHYLLTRNEEHAAIFLSQAGWLVEHETRIGEEETSGWPISWSHPAKSTGDVCLSAETQGKAVSVLARAYQLTGDEVFLESARRAICTYEKDILDGGICAPILGDGIIFEDVAVYPAAHAFSGFMYGLFGLYDYLAITEDRSIEPLIERSLATLSRLLDEFDVGFWTRPDLLKRQLSSPAELALQVKLLEALAGYAADANFAAIATRWDGYQRGLVTRLRYQLSRSCMQPGRAVLKRMRKSFFASRAGSSTQSTSMQRICVAVNAFPVLGGIRTVLAGIEQVTGDVWQIEYLTREIGPRAEGFAIHRFGPKRMGPWLFPFVWFYAASGGWKLLRLMRQGAGYQVFLPQDGVFTAAFMGLVARLVGVRVVCIDHANLTLLKSRVYRAERLQIFDARSWAVRLLIRVLYRLYWPSLYMLAWIAARCVDHYLIPGVAGDGVEEMCSLLGVPPSRITRFDSMIDIGQHRMLDGVSRAETREKYGLATDAIVVSIICRLALEKGLDTAVEGLSLALSGLVPDLRKRVRVVIAGDGPIRGQVEEDIRRRGLSQTCLLRGDIPAEEVRTLLAITDIFLNTSTRGTCFPMSILEAMAAGCAVIASREPLGNVHLLAEGRGIAVPPCDPERTGEALVQLVSEPNLCRRMGEKARSYIAEYHSPTRFRRTLMRMTFCSALDGVLERSGEGRASL